MGALPAPSRRRAVRFARDLEDPRADVDPVVLALRSLGHCTRSSALGPDPEFRDALRRRLVAVAAVSEGPQVEPADHRGRLHRLRAGRGAAVAAGSMAVIVAIAGAGVAGARSLPGDPLYSLKRGSEAVDLRLAGSQIERAEKQLRAATTRLAEVESLLARSLTAVAPLIGTGVLAAGPPQAAGLPGRLVDTFADMDAATEEGRSLITEGYWEDREPESLELLSTWSHEQAERLEALLPELPEPVRPAAEQSLATVQAAGHEAEAMLAGVCLAECVDDGVVSVVACDCPVEAVPEPGADGPGPGGDDSPTKADGTPVAPVPDATPPAPPAPGSGAPPTGVGSEAGPGQADTAPGLPERAGSRGEQPPPPTPAERSQGPALPKAPVIGDRPSQQTPLPQPPGTTLPVPGLGGASTESPP
jgi:hypothetical protein